MQSNAEFQKVFRALKVTHEDNVQAYLGDIVGLVPDHCNKASHKFFGFPVHIKVMFTLYCSLLSVQ